MVDERAEIRVYDKKMSLQNILGDLDYYSLTPRKNAQGSGEIALPFDSPLNDLFRTPGTRLSISYRGEYTMSGPIRTQQGSFITRTDDSSCIYAVQDDWRVLENTIAWVAPGGPLQPANLTGLGQAWATGPQTTGTVENQSGYFLWPTSVRSAETAIKLVIRQNLVERLRRPVTILPDQSRGGDARAAGQLPDIRNQTVAEAISGLLDWSGLVLNVWQDFNSPTLFVDVFESSEWSQVITPESGIIEDGDWSRKPPSATRALVLGNGEDAARSYMQVVDSTLEDLYGDIIEVTRDATGATLKWPEGLDQKLQVAKYYLTRSDVSATDKAAFVTYLQAAGADALSDGAGTSSVALTLTETKSFRFNSTIFVGDTITAESNGIRITDRIEEADITFSPDKGDLCVPVLGKRSDDPDRVLWDAISGNDKAIRELLRKR